MEYDILDADEIFQDIRDKFKKHFSSHLELENILYKLTEVWVEHLNYRFNELTKWRKKELDD